MLLFDWNIVYSSFVATHVHAIGQKMKMYRATFWVVWFKNILLYINTQYRLLKTVVDSFAPTHQKLTLVYEGIQWFCVFEIEREWKNHDDKGTTWTLCVEKRHILHTRKMTFSHSYRSCIVFDSKFVFFSSIVYRAVSCCGFSRHIHACKWNY